MANQQLLSNLKSHLNLVKSLNDDTADDQFFKLMVKAKDSFGDLGAQMGLFYFEYANYILKKIQKNIDIFNEGNLPNQADGLQEIEDNDEEDQNLQEKRQQKEQPQNQNIQADAHELPNQVTINKQQKKQQQPNKNQDNDVADQDQRQICFCNLQCSLKIYQGQRQKINQGNSSIFSQSQINQALIKVRTRLGDLYVLNENYDDAVNQYLQVLKQYQKINGSQSNRHHAQIHYLIGNTYLYDNKQGCQKKAISQFIRAVNILLNHLKPMITYEFNFDIPTEQHTKVDRLAYLAQPTDSSQVTELKDVISCLLDKIEDTFDQIGVKVQLQMEKQKLAQSQPQKNQFKEVAKDIPIVKLGSFGNRKKAAKEDQQPQNIEKSKQNKQ